MAITDKSLISRLGWAGGEILKFQLANGYTLSLVSTIIIGSSHLAWEGAIINRNGDFTTDTQLTSNGALFIGDAEANAWIEKAHEWASCEAAQ